MSFSELCVILSFLDNAARLATRDYEPTDDDIVRARLRTLDIQEYEMNVGEGMQTSFVAARRANTLIFQMGIPMHKHGGSMMSAVRVPRYSTRYLFIPLILRYRH